MLCTWDCRLFTVSIRAGSWVRALFSASTSIFFNWSVISGRSCIMASNSLWSSVARLVFTVSARSLTRLQASMTLL